MRVWIRGTKIGTYCKNGHELTRDNCVDNVYINNGRKQCKICTNKYARKYYHKKKSDTPINKEKSNNKKVSLWFKCGHLRMSFNFERKIQNGVTYLTCLACRMEAKKIKRRLRGTKVQKIYATEELRSAAKFRYREARQSRKENNFVEHVNAKILYERDKGICQICMEPVYINNFHVDHIIPLSKGGEHSYKNTQISHPSCNHKKSNKIGFKIIK